MENHRTHKSYGDQNRSAMAFARRAPVLAPASVAGSPPIAARASVGWIDAALTRLGPQEYRRRLWHFVPGLLALVGAWIPHQDPLIVAAGTFVFCTALGGVAFSCQCAIRRPEEQNCHAAILGYAAAVIPLFLFFPSQPELALAVAGVIAFGDGSATLAGLLAGSRKLPWNTNKSWAGTVAFIAVGLPMTMLIYWHGSVPHPSLEQTILCAGTTVVASALVESLPFRGNDNLLVGVSAATTMIVMHGPSLSGGYDPAARQTP